jgi:hypothetical protein
VAAPAAPDNAPPVNGQPAPPANAPAPAPEAADNDANANDADKAAARAAAAAEAQPQPEPPVPAAPDNAPPVNGQPAPPANAAPPAPAEAVPGRARRDEEAVQRKPNVQRVQVPQDEERPPVPNLGANMNEVAAHRNPQRPAQIGAQAFAQGNNIHLGRGQEQHLPHEAWHVAQQQGRVRQDDEAAQRKPTASDGGFQADSSVEQSLAAKKGHGNPLPDDVRVDMEARFGTDFSRVTIHTGSSAGRLNKQLKAQAFTHGRDIYFAPGKYDPGSGAGKRLLAHELTHVVQQTGGQKPQKLIAQNNQSANSITTINRKETGVVQRNLTDSQKRLLLQHPRFRQRQQQQKIEDEEERQERRDENADKRKKWKQEMEANKNKPQLSREEREKERLKTLKGQYKIEQRMKVPMPPSGPPPALTPSPTKPPGSGKKKPISFEKELKQKRKQMGIKDTKPVTTPKDWTGEKRAAKKVGWETLGVTQSIPGLGSIVGGGVSARQAQGGKGKKAGAFFGTLMGRRTGKMGTIRHGTKVDNTSFEKSQSELEARPTRSGSGFLSTSAPSSETPSSDESMSQIVELLKGKFGAKDTDKDTDTDSETPKKEDLEQKLSTLKQQMTSLEQQIQSLSSD